MNADEARILLSACRPDSVDREDPVFREALALVEHDPELKDWWEAEQAFDAAMRDRIHEIAPPAALRAEILAGMQASATAKPPDRGKPEATGSARKRIAFPGTGLTWAAAAAVALIVGTALIERSAPELSPAAGPPGAAATAARPLAASTASLVSFFEKTPPPGYRLDHTERDLASLKAYLNRAGTPAPQAVPPALARGDAIGCMTLNYNGHAIGMICFDAGGQVAHLFAFDKAALSGKLPESQPAILEGEQDSYAIWTVNEQVLVLKRPGSPEELKNYL